MRKMLVTLVNIRNRNIYILFKSLVSKIKFSFEKKTNETHASFEPVMSESALNYKGK